MENKRRLELLAYAKVCFDKCTSPFETIHLAKKNVTADECRELSYMIADILEGSVPLSEGLIAQAEKEFAETQT